MISIILKQSCCRHSKILILQCGWAWFLTNTSLPSILGSCHKCETMQEILVANLCHGINSKQFHSATWHCMLSINIKIIAIIKPKLVLQYIIYYDCDLRIVSIAGLEVLLPRSLVAVQLYSPSSESVTSTIVRVSVSAPAIFCQSSLCSTASLSHEYVMRPVLPFVTLHRNVAFLPIEIL